MIGWLIDLTLGRKEEVHMNDFEAEELDRLLGNPPRADRTEAYWLMKRCAMTIGQMGPFVRETLGKPTREDGEDTEELLERLAERVEVELMGDRVEPRRDFIVENALYAANIDT